MKINAILPEKGRDLRLSTCFGGVANWAIFLDHDFPTMSLNWITTRNYEL